MCLASGERNFIPPRAVVEFAQRCRWIGRFMRAPEGDGRSIVPWGWDMQLKERLLKEGVPAEELPSDGELEFIKENSRREVAQQLLEHLAKEVSMVSPDYRIVAHSLQEVEEFLEERGRVVLKAPLSGSGKGVRFVTGGLMETDRGWCRRILESQGAVIVEQRLDVVQEFAMLFEVGAAQCGMKPWGAAPCEEDSARVEGTCIGRIKFLGYSMFYASNGAYKGNLLASNSFLEEKLEGIAGKETLEELVENGESEEFGKSAGGADRSGEMDMCAGKTILKGIRDKVAGFLQKKLGGRYTGFVGVDMFLYRDGEGRILLNPAVEINLRMTMGLIARNIYDWHREEFSLGEGTHCFEPERGIFPVEER